MTQEALKLALEALEGVLDDAPKVLDASISGGLYEVVQCRDAITAIKEALAQTQEPDDIASILACRDMLDAQPVPPRTWVGLTDEEMKELWENKGWYVTMYKAVEAKLKEKNT